MLKAIVVMPAALMLCALAACAEQSDSYPGTAGNLPYYERGIDQDIDASHGVDTPTARSVGLPNPITELDQPSE